MEKIKAGVIGTGFIGPAHVEALRRLGSVEVLALADINQQIADQKAIELNVPLAYGDYGKLLENPDIGSVHICAPNNLHFQMAKEALECGKHVVCEKPLAMTSEQARMLIKTAERTSSLNAVHFNLRFYPIVRQAREMIRNGDLGEILAVNGTYQQDWLFFDTDYSWRLEPEISGASRAVADIGSHWFDTVEFITGIKTKEVCADFATVHPIRKKPRKPALTYSGKLLPIEDYQEILVRTEDYAAVLLRFDNGAHGSVVINQTAAGRKNSMRIEICGTKASLAFDSERANELWIGYREKNNEVMLKDPSLLYPEARGLTAYPGGHLEGYPDTSKQMFKKVYEAILKQRYAEEEPDFATFKDGLRELVLCETIVQSAGEQRWLQVPGK